MPHVERCWARKTRFGIKLSASTEREVHHVLNITYLYECVLLKSHDESSNYEYGGLKEFLISQKSKLAELLIAENVLSRTVTACYRLLGMVPDGAEPLLPLHDMLKFLRNVLTLLMESVDHDLSAWQRLLEELEESRLIGLLLQCGTLSSCRVEAFHILYELLQCSETSSLVLAILRPHAATVWGLLIEKIEQDLIGAFAMRRDIVTLILVHQECGEELWKSFFQAFQEHLQSGKKSTAPYEIMLNLLRHYTSDYLSPDMTDVFVEAHEYLVEASLRPAKEKPAPRIALVMLEYFRQLLRSELLYTLHEQILPFVLDDLARTEALPRMMTDLRYGVKKETT